MIAVPFNFDDPGLGLALLAVLVGLRVGVFVFDKFRARPPQPVAETPHTPLAEFGAPAVALAADGCATVLPASERTIDPLEFPIPALPVSEPVGDDMSNNADAVDDTPDDDEAEEAQGRGGRFMVELLDSAIIAVILVFWIIRPFVISAYFIPTPSMEPTLMRQDKLLATRVPYWFHPPRRGDVVVFNAPEVALRASRQPYNPKKPTEFVKRVIGVPGDRIRIVEGRGVFVNGELRQEPTTIPVTQYSFPYAYDGSFNFQTDPDVRRELRPHINEARELVVPEGNLFVMGDNRNDSCDSHAWGFLPADRVIARAAVIFWPPPRWGWVR
jgi:signal peptidase I